MKTIIKVSCTDQDLKITEEPLIASGGKHENFIQFTFCEKWDGMAKTAVFYNNPKQIKPYYADVNDANECEVPHEVTANSGTMYFGVFGVLGETTRTSKVEGYKVRLGAITTELVPSDPTPEIWEQLLLNYDEALKTVEDALNEVIEMREENEQFKIEVRNELSAIPKYTTLVVDALPTTDISESTIYLVPENDGVHEDLYTEYIYSHGRWEALGTQRFNLKDVVVALLHSEWVENENGTYSQTVTVESIGSNSNPDVLLYPSNSVDITDELKAYLCLEDETVIEDKKVTFVASELPEISFTVVLKGAVTTSGDQIVDISSVLEKLGEYEDRISELESEIESEVEKVATLESELEEQSSLIEQQQLKINEQDITIKQHQEAISNPKRIIGYDESKRVDIDKTKYVGLTKSNWYPVTEDGLIQITLNGYADDSQLVAVSVVHINDDGTASATGIGGWNHSLSLQVFKGQYVMVIDYRSSDDGSVSTYSFRPYRYSN